jgi:signal transduction histidine kinase
MRCSHLSSIERRASVATKPIVPFCGVFPAAVRDERRRAILIVFFLAVSVHACSNHTEPPRPIAKAGVFRIGDEHSLDHAYPLDGEWQFAFGEFLTAAEFDARADNACVEVPMDWRGDNMNGRVLPSTGFASYRLRVEFASDRGAVSVSIPAMTSYIVFINGRISAKSGKVGSGPESSRAEYKPAIIENIETTGPVDIVVWTSNYQYWKGGLWYSAFLGSTDAVRNLMQDRLMLDYITISISLCLGLCVLIFSLFLKEERFALLLVFLTCLYAATYTAATGELSILRVLPGISWEWLIRVELGSWCAGNVVWYPLFRKLLPHEFPRKLVLILISFPLVMSLVIMFTPIIIHSEMVPYFKWYNGIAGVISLSRMYVAVRRGREGAALLFSAISLWFVFYAYATAYNESLIHTYIPVMAITVTIVIVILIMLARRYALAYRRIEHFAEELELRVEQRTDELRRTQDQLIHREKLAALGQLTAGIAHELKNPLNFVNNFAGVSAELIEELPHDIHAREDVAPVLEELRTSVDRVKVHGMRANRIIEGMMLHARGGSGERRTADINLLLDEAADLAYHSARARLVDFNAEIVRTYDPALPPLSVFPQDLSRVFLNLLSNAIDAVHVRRESNTEAEYRPKIILSTMVRDGSVEIRIRDNGVGVPSEVRDKLFTPFFTTKRAGEGTGLGLSISYDIIRKAHNGDIRLNTDTADMTEFIVCLPIEKTPCTRHVDASSS